MSPDLARIGATVAGRPAPRMSPNEAPPANGTAWCSPPRGPWASVVEGCTKPPRGSRGARSGAGPYRGAGTRLCVPLAEVSLSRAAKFRPWSASEVYPQTGRGAGAAARARRRWNRGRGPIGRGFDGCKGKQQPGGQRPHVREDSGSAVDGRADPLDRLADRSGEIPDGVPRRPDNRPGAGDGDGRRGVGGNGGRGGGGGGGGRGGVGSRGGPGSRSGGSGGGGSGPRPGVRFSSKRTRWSRGRNLNVCRRRGGGVREPRRRFGLRDGHRFGRRIGGLFLRPGPVRNCRPSGGKRRNGCLRRVGLGSEDEAEGQQSAEEQHHLQRARGRPARAPGAGRRQNEQLQRSRRSEPSQMARGAERSPPRTTGRCLHDPPGLTQVPCY